MRLLLCSRPTRPRRLLRSPPPLLVFPASKVCSQERHFRFIHKLLVCANHIKEKKQMCIWALCFSLLQIEHFETCFTDGKRKKNLNIEKPKTLKTSQNDKLFLKKKKKRKRLTLPGLGMVWLDLDHKQKFVEKKNSKIEKIEIIKFECIPLFYVILLCQCSEYPPTLGRWQLGILKGDLYRKLLAVINSINNLGSLFSKLLQLSTATGHT